MSIQRSVVFKSLVIPFYRQRAALLGFVFFIMTLSVGRANGVGLLEYHYALIKGVMISPSFMAIVMTIWFLYALKCAQFVVLTLRKPAFSYLYMLSQVSAQKLYWLLLLAQAVLMLPILSYVVVMAGVGYHEHWYMPTNLVLLFNILVCVAGARYYVYLLRNPGVRAFTLSWQWPSWLQRTYYAGFLLRYVLANEKMLFLAIKIYNCVTLYLMLTGRNPAEQPDIRMMVLFYSVGILGHGVLVFRLKEMENTRLTFYRSLPVSLGRRFAQYALFYGCVFLPETLVIATRTPGFLYWSEAFFLVGLGYSILLLLNSLQLFNYVRLKDYIAAIMQIFYAVIVGMITRELYLLPVLFFALSVFIFFRKYYQFEAGQQSML